MNYILEGQTPVLCHDITKWALWMGESERRVAWSEVGPWDISTVFLGVDHSFGMGRPILFETMVFYKADNLPPDAPKQYFEYLDQHMRRYHTWDEAEAGHERVVLYVEKKTGLKRTEPEYEIDERTS